MTRWPLALPLVLSAGCARPPPAPPEAVRWPVEIKLEVAPSAVRTLGLADDDADSRELWFYDTPTRALEARGLTLRSRKIPDAPDDSTVKVRPIPADPVGPWRDTEGFKCEIDRTGDTNAAACALTVEQDSGEIRRAGRGKRRVRKLFSRDQEAFAEQHATVPWDALIAFGPVASAEWTLDVPGVASEVTLERWTLAGSEPIVELSTRTSAARADRVAEALRDFARARGLEAREGDTKTRRALDRLAPK